MSKSEAINIEIIRSIEDKESIDISINISNITNVSEQCKKSTQLQNDVCKHIKLIGLHNHIYSKQQYYLNIQRKMWQMKKMNHEARVKFK